MSEEKSMAYKQKKMGGGTMRGRYNAGGMYKSVQDLEQHCSKKASVLNVAKGYGDKGKNALEAVSITIQQTV